MKITISSKDRALCEAARARIAAEAEVGLSLCHTMKDMHGRAAELKEQLEKEGLALKIDDNDTAILAHIIKSEKLKIAIARWTKASWDFDHYDSSVTHDFAAEFVSGPVNVVANALVSELTKQLTATLGAKDAAKAAESAQPVADLREMAAARFTSEETEYDMILEASKRIVVFLDVYLSGEWDHQKVMADMAAVGRRA